MPKFIVEIRIPKAKTCEVKALKIEANSHDQAFGKGLAYHAGCCVLSTKEVKEVAE